MITVKDVLEHLGYKLQSYNDYWRMNALYRKSNSLSLSVNKNSGWFSDFVTGENGPLHHLVALTLGTSREHGLKYLKNLSFSGKEHLEKEKTNDIKNEESIKDDFLKDLLPSYSFYKNKGISESTLKLFKSGVKTYGKLNNRYVFPVFDENQKIIGVCGRDLFNNSERPKWKIIGKKSNFVYPYWITEEYIEKAGEVILVESIGDGLALYEAGIKNFLVLFGTKVSKNIILYLVRQNVNKIIVATNNDTTSSSNWGEKGAIESCKQLSKFFRTDQIELRLPTKKDFGEMSQSEIIKWYNGQTAVMTG